MFKDFVATSRWKGFQWVIKRQHRWKYLQQQTLDKQISWNQKCWAAAESPWQ